MRFRQSIPQIRKRIEARMMRDTGWVDEFRVREELRRYADARRAHRATVEAINLGAMGDSERASKLQYNIEVLGRMKVAGESGCKIAAQERFVEKLRKV